MGNYRLKYSITGLARYISHLDMAQVFERSMRRAGLPLAFSEGFNPHPRFSFGSALAVGVSSTGEYLDVMLKNDLPPEIIKEKLNETLPQGFAVEKVIKIEGKGKSLMAIINRAIYQVELPMNEINITEEQLATAIEELLAKPEIKVARQTKKGLKEKDIREGIFSVAGKVTDEKLIFTLLLATGSEMNVRPEEVVSLIAASLNVQLQPGGMYIHREGLYKVERNGQITTP